MRLAALAVALVCAMSGAAQATGDTASPGQWPHRPMTTTGIEFNCHIPPGYAAVKSLSELPTALREKYKGALPLGTWWNNTDDRSDNDPYGIEFVLHNGRRWIVGQSSIGIAVWLYFTVYDLEDDGTPIEVKFPEPEPKGLCDPLVRIVALPRSPRR
ncbi:MAG TPA: hypothetical protein VMU08_11160 [Rhizomicrobium sp.]|nr:hypothetical protein [Rhizomicrobium sp.]